MQTKWLLDLFLLAAIWGASFMFMRISIPEMGTFPLTFFRTAIATIFLATLLYFKNKNDLAKLFTHGRTLALIALVSTAIPFSLWGTVSLWLESGTMAVINATTPMFGALIAFLWLKETLSKSAILGLMLGFAGVCVIMIVPKAGVNIELLPVFLGLMAATCYGTAANLTKAKAQGLSPMLVATGSQFYSSIFLFPLAWYFLPDTLPTAAAWGSAVVLAVLCTGYALYMYFQLIAEQGITKTLSVTYLIPLSAIFWGWLVLDEQLQLRVFIGGVCILVGVAFTTGYLKLRKKALSTS